MGIHKKEPPISFFKTRKRTKKGFFFSNQFSPPPFFFPLFFQEKKHPQKKMQQTKKTKGKKLGGDLAKLLQVFFFWGVKHTRVNGKTKIKQQKVFFSPLEKKNSVPNI